MTVVVRDAFTGYCRIDYTVRPRLSPRGLISQKIVWGGNLFKERACFNQSQSITKLIYSWLLTVVCKTNLYQLFEGVYSSGD